MILLLWLAVLITPVRLQYSLNFIDSTPNSCKKPVNCTSTNNVTFMGTILPYNSTTYDLLPYQGDVQAMIMEKLSILQTLQYIPKCWAVVQPFLCSLFMPKCSNNTVELPSYDRCRLVYSHCKIAVNSSIWPSFINCSDETLFPQSCKRDYYYPFREPKFNSTGKCLHPLVPTDNPLAVFEGVEGCGTPCSNPMYTQDEKNQIHSVIFYAASFCFIFNFFTVVTFIIDRRSAMKAPASAIFWLNLWYMISCFGWLLQFLKPGIRDVIVCKKDGTLRINESSGDNLLCMGVFILIYFSNMAAMIWYVILTYMWYIKFKAYGTIQDRIDKNSPYFHVIAWCLPIIMTVFVLAFGEIDGNHETGICFVGYHNFALRAYSVLVPSIIAAFVGGYFTIRALRLLLKIKNSGPKSISDHNSAKIGKVITRIGRFSVLLLIPIFTTFYCHLYEFQNSWKWKEIFRNYTVCRIISPFASEISECKMHSTPSAGKLQLHLLAPFVTGILMAHWIITDKTVQSWKRFLKRYAHYFEAFFCWFHVFIFLVKITDEYTVYKLPLVPTAVFCVEKSRKSAGVTEKFLTSLSPVKIIVCVSCATYLAICVKVPRKV